MMELVDMNSLGLFNLKIVSVQVGFTLFDILIVNLIKLVLFKLKPDIICYNFKFLYYII